MTVLKHNGTRAIGQQAAAQIARWDNIFSLYTDNLCEINGIRIENYRMIDI